MKLEELTGQKLLRAMSLYLRLAYPHGMIPPHVRDLAQVEPDAPLEHSLQREEVEKVEDPDRPGFIDKYRWRLGNERYPHMKLGIERCSRADDFVLNVDTHDRNFPLGSPILRDPAFRKLLDYNSRLKRAIEEAWRRADLPTLHGHVVRYLGRQCPFGPRPKTILVVDDDEAVLELERALLEEAGYRVLTASSGQAALEATEKSGPVHLCLLDIMMPLLDGLDVARMMRESGAPRFPIVYVTALPRDRAADAEADGYIAKPFDPDHLLDMVRQHAK